MVRGVKALGMETCMTLGMLTAAQAQRPQRPAGLDYYNHNIDTSPDCYRRSSPPARCRSGSTALEHVRQAGA
jgi:biotin synthase